MCVEVEMSDSQSKFYENKKFAEKKFSDLLNDGGFDKPEPVKKFAISEKVFKKDLEFFIEKLTKNFFSTEDSIKIEVI